MKLIKETGKQRYYQLDFNIYETNCNGKKLTIEQIFKSDPLNFMPEWELAEPTAMQYVNKVCLSDAREHTERLVFPVFKIKNKETGEEKIIHRCNGIAGTNTMMIHGGDPSLVWDDKVYIRQLRMINAKYNKAVSK